MHVVRFQLQETPAPEKDPGPRGWFVPGSDSTYWIEALVAQSRSVPMRYFIAPHSIRDQRPDGLICLPRGGGPTTRTDRDVERTVRQLGAIQLRQLQTTMGVELWIPAAGSLYPNVPVQLPAISDSQEQRVLVWLPNCGLLGLEPTDAIEPSRFFLTPKDPNLHAEIRWTSPPLGVVVGERIVSIGYRTPPALEDVFQQEEIDIGGSPLGEGGLYSPSDGTKLAMSQNKFKEWLLEKLEAMAGKTNGNEKRMPGEASSSSRSQTPTSSSKASQSGTGLGAMIQGLSLQMYNYLSKSLASKRHEQIEKLLQMMKDDPDNALKYAIPLSSEMSGLHRGLGTPNWKLTPNATTLSQGGGGLADYWDIRGDMQYRMRASYREQANREIALGRYRRAAYIYAHLLGELSTAATVLEQGKLYREAALLYSEKLNRPRDQARCLVLAGLPHEAAPIYAKLKDFENEADAWQQAEQPELARKALELAVEAALNRKEIMVAVRIIDEKLHDRPRAEELLWRQWPSNSSALESVQLAFRWLGQDSRHEDAHAKLSECAALCKSTHDELIAGLAVHLYQDYPHAGVKNQAEDLGRITIARLLLTDSIEDLRRPTSLLSNLATQDELLIRDSFRYRDRKALNAEAKRNQGPSTKKTNALIPSTKQPLATTKIVTLPTYRLIPAERYLCIKSVGNDLLAISLDQAVVTVHRTTRLSANSPSTVSKVLHDVKIAADTKIDFIYDEQDGAIRVQLFADGERLDFSPVELNHPQSDDPSWRISPLAINSLPVACAAGAANHFWCITFQHNILELQWHGGGSVQTYDFTAEYIKQVSLLQSETGLSAPISPENMHLLVVGTRPYIVCDFVLMTLVDGQPLTLAILPGSVRQAAGSLPLSRNRIAFATSQAFSLAWLDFRSAKTTLITTDLEFRCVAWMPKGRIATTTDLALHIYDATVDGARLVQQIIVSRTPQSIVIADHDTILLCHDSGTIERFRLE